MSKQGKATRRTFTARNRVIWPTLWNDPRFYKMSRAARLIYIGIVSLSDDEGRLDGEAHSLRMRILPGDDDVKTSDVQTWRDEIAKSGLITVYVDPNRTEDEFTHVTDWAETQHVRYPRASWRPAPPEVAS